MSNSIVERVRKLVAPICADLDLDLYDVEYNGGQLTVTIDSTRAQADAAAAAAADEDAEADEVGADDDADASADDDDTPPRRGPGITLDVLALATRLISREMDHSDPIPGHYTLEVTSPGLERTLRTPAHFTRSVGSEVAVRLRDVAGGDRRVHGVLSAAGEQTFTVTRPDGTEREVPYEQVDRARTVFHWGPAPKPAKGAKPKPAAAARRPKNPTPTTAPDDITEAPAP